MAAAQLAPAARKTVAVIGLGTAGAATAALLGREGHRVKLFEKYPIDCFDASRGAGIGLQPIGLTVLKRLGILGPILDLGARVDRLHSVTPAGRAVLDLKYEDFHPALYGLGINRNALFTELYHLARGTPGVEIECGVDVATVEVGSTPGAKPYVVCRDGTREGPFDLAVVADGRSSIRRGMPVHSVEQPYPFGCLWALLPDEGAVFCRDRTLQQTLDTAEVMLGVLPTGKTQADVADNRPDAPDLVTLFWSLELAKLDAVRDAGIDAWKERVLGYMPKLSSHLEHINSFDDLIVAKYSDTWMKKYHMGDNVVFLGDAAHATSPQLGQGANLALVDAWTLAQSLREFPEPSAVGAALRHFDAARRWRLRFYQLNSHLLTPVFQSNSRLLGTGRDLLMGPACRFWLTKMQMLTVLCGAQNNGIPWTTIPPEEFLHHVLDTGGGGPTTAAAAPATL